MQYVEDLQRWKHIHSTAPTLDDQLKKMRLARMDFSSWVAMMRLLQKQLEQLLKRIQRMRKMRLKKR
jgi:uncharacterized protein with von Willebrand factor type A (vWA) domain